jgi:hypothetical protein
MAFHVWRPQIAPAQPEVGEHLAEKTGATPLPAIFHNRKTVTLIERTVASLSAGLVEPNRDDASRAQRFDPANELARGHA